MWCETIRARRWRGWDGIGHRSRHCLLGLGGRSRGGRNRHQRRKLDRACSVPAGIAVVVAVLATVVLLVAPGRLVTGRIARLVEVVRARRLAGDAVVASVQVPEAAAVSLIGLVAPGVLVAGWEALLVGVVGARRVAGDEVVAHVVVAFLPVVVAVALVAPGIGVARRVAWLARVAGAWRIAVGVAVAEVDVVRRVEGLVGLPSAWDVPALWGVPVLRRVPAAVPVGPPALGRVPVAVASLVPSWWWSARNPVVSAVPAPLSDAS